MKKNLIVIGIISVLILAVGAILALLLWNRPIKTTVLGATTTAQTGLSASQIKSNAQKYQPQGSGPTCPNVFAAAAIVVDENQNKIICAKNTHARRAPASITKVASLAVATENLNDDQLITISKTAADVEPNKIVMNPGEKLKAQDLYAAMMMISANDAAWAVAEAVPGGFNHFVALMNQKARDLGLSDSHFMNPAGLDDARHYSSVFDIATFVRYDLTNHPEFLEYAGDKKDYSVYQTDRNQSHWWSHISHMLFAYPGMIAAKTGFTDVAGSTYVGVAERNGRRITLVMMGSDVAHANGDVQTLLDFGFAQK